MKIIGMIPARAGSKGLPGKNIMQMCGKPMLQYTVEAAMASKLDKVYLNSDSREYIEMMQKATSVDGYIREKGFGSDSASMKDVLCNFVQFRDGRDNREDYAIMVLYPTYPLRTANDIDTIIDSFLSKVSTPTIGLKPPGTHPYLCYEKQGDSYKAVVNPDENKYYRRQDYPKHWELTHFACIVLAKHVFLVNNQLMMPAHQNYMDLSGNQNVHDINTQQDFDMVENIMKNRNGRITTEAKKDD